jgi:hypothetical protein
LVPYGRVWISLFIAHNKSETFSIDANANAIANINSDTDGNASSNYLVERPALINSKSKRG